MRKQYAHVPIICSCTITAKWYSVYRLILSGINSILIFSGKEMSKCMCRLQWKLLFTCSSLQTNIVQWIVWTMSYLALVSSFRSHSLANEYLFAFWRSSLLVCRSIHCSSKLFGKLFYPILIDVFKVNRWAVVCRSYSTIVLPLPRRCGVSLGSNTLSFTAHFDVQTFIVHQVVIATHWNWTGFCKDFTLMDNRFVWCVSIWFQLFSNTVWALSPCNSIQGISVLIAPLIYFSINLRFHKSNGMTHFKIVSHPSIRKSLVHGVY